MKKDGKSPHAEHDHRWGGYVPWFFRSSILGTGNFSLFLERVAQRVHRLLLFNEAGLPNLSHFGSKLESDTHQRFRLRLDLPPGSHLESVTIQDQVRDYFLPSTIKTEATKRAQTELVGRKRGLEEIGLDFLSRSQREQHHFMELVSDRIGTLEVLLRTLPQDHTSINEFRNSICRFLAEAKIMLDIRGTPPRLVPIDDPLLNQEVTQPLLITLQGRFPEIGDKFIKAYHDLLLGNDSNDVFGDAFKALEVLAKELTGNSNLMLNKSDQVKKSFPLLHATTIKTIVNLAGHRGDEGGHGGKGPVQQEMRYLLFEICNIALLMLECYPRTEHPAVSSST